MIWLIGIVVWIAGAFLSWTLVYGGTRREKMEEKMTLEMAKKIKAAGLHEPGATGTCPACGTGTYHGGPAGTCDNPKCILHDRWAFTPCPRCGEERRACAC